MTANNSTDFPVDSFKDAAPHLRRPFTPEAVRFKVQTVWRSGSEVTGALIVAYIDARLVAERLNMVCPQLWSDDYETTGKGMLCRLTIDGVTRTDYGDGYVGKGLFSDAFKRAAVKFGVGVSLYATPSASLNVGPHIKVKGQGDKQSATLTPDGERTMRQQYSIWLERVGADAFGQPLDHGDTADSVGDVEAMAPAHDVEGDGGETIDAATAKALVDRAWKIPRVKKGYQLAAGYYAGHDVGDCSTKAKAVTATQTLTVAQADGLAERIGKAEAENE